MKTLIRFAVASFLAVVFVVAAHAQVWPNEGAGVTNTCLDTANTIATIYTAKEQIGPDATIRKLRDADQEPTIVADPDLYLMIGVTAPSKEIAYVSGFHACMALYYSRVKYRR